MWKEDRRLLSPSFKYQRFDGFLTYFNKHSKILVEILDKVFVEGNSKKDKSGGKEKDVNLHPYLSRATMDFISGNFPMKRIPTYHYFWAITKIFGLQKMICNRICSGP